SAAIVSFRHASKATGGSSGWVAKPPTSLASPIFLSILVLSNGVDALCLKIVMTCLFVDTCGCYVVIHVGVFERCWAGQRLGALSSRDTNPNVEGDTVMRT